MPAAALPTAEELAAIQTIIALYDGDDAGGANYLLSPMIPDHFRALDNSIDALRAYLERCP